ncbi:hypothetical protein B0T17DRAFT_620039 [Bombardia bombarda]|uniref:Uncharacterized protein n=1 Tax=Bombardia bombarda TaxID=252184 RepID=A0AA40BVL4_9PEZI|nr:hypothetical protein B0T17DRAFT_620039 [Bombardia bombarda]
MPTVEEPKKQPPMNMGLEDMDPSRFAGSARIVTEQPRPEPLPSLENEMTLRGGRFTIGCNCCDGHCSFHKGCC